jgi:3-deoxy-7-phosphoheptulonate synthase
MIIIMEPHASDEQINKVVNRVQELGLKAILNKGEIQTVVAVIGDETSKVPSTDVFDELSGVFRTERVQVPFRLASRTFKKEDSVYEIIPGVKIGGNEDLLVMAGPCSVESEEGIMQTAHAAKAGGAKVLRGGAYKPRTAPRTFEGLGELGLKLLKQASKETGLAVVTEIMDIRDLDLVCEAADIIQVGARNMQNFSMLNELGKSKKPILLKRGMSSTIDEWLLAAERIIHHGNERVILCERGIRSFDSKYTRNVLDLAAIPVIKQLSHLPIISDPSHGTGKTAYVKSMTLASVATGADGLIIEIHPDPENALSDGPQSLKFHQFYDLMEEVKQVRSLVKPMYSPKKSPAGV